MRVIFFFWLKVEERQQRCRKIRQTAEEARRTAVRDEDCEGDEGVEAVNRDRKATTLNAPSNLSENFVDFFGLILKLQVRDSGVCTLEFTV